MYDGDSWNDQKQRRENRWEDYLCKNSYNVKIEPIDYFFPIIIFGLMNNPKDTVVSGKSKYARLLIRRCNENNTKENIS